MPQMTVPIIGIGAGPATDGQVLVFHDLLGIREGNGAKFVRRYADLLDAMADGVAEYAREVRGGVFPAPEHGYGIDEAELARVPRAARRARPRRGRAADPAGDGAAGRVRPGGPVVDAGRRATGAAAHRERRRDAAVVEPRRPTCVAGVMRGLRLATSR